MNSHVKNQIEVKEDRKQRYDKDIRADEFQVGDSVLILNTAKKGEGRKLQPLYTGPHKILEIISEVNSKIMVGRTPKVVHNNRLKKYIPKPNPKPPDIETNLNRNVAFLQDSTTSENRELPLPNLFTKLNGSVSQIKQFEETIDNSTSGPKPVVDPLRKLLQTFPWAKYSKKACAMSMLNMGFEPGKGLGKSLQGISEAMHTGENPCNFDSNKHTEFPSVNWSPIKFIKAQN